MAKCYNCGCEIAEGDKTRLCDNCKRVMLPFIKLMDASTSSAVRRLIANERNLRNHGVTDDGMEYLLRVCELRDKKKNEERAAREAKRAAEAVREPEPEVRNYSEVELPIDEPLDLISKPYGSVLPAAELILIISGVGLVAWCVYTFVIENSISFTSLIGAVASISAAYVADVLRKTKKDLDEIKKRFI